MQRDSGIPLLYVGTYAIVLVLVPLAFLLYYALHLSTSGLFYSVLTNAVEQSFIQGTLSTAISLVVGIFFGLLLVLYNGRLKNVIISLLLITYVMPGLIMALGIISIFGFSSRFWEIIYGNVIYNAPMIAVLAFSTGSTTSIREVYSAKTMGAKDSEIIRRFYLPNSLRGGLLGGILTFVLAFEGFSLPLIIGGPHFSTMEVMIYQFKSIFPTFSHFPFSTASFLGVLQLVILMIPLYAYLSIRTHSRRNDSNLPIPLKRYNGLALLGLFIFLIFVMLPLFSMFIKYPIWQINLTAIATKLQISMTALISNTLLFSFVSTFIAFMISIIVTVYRLSIRNQFIVLLPLILSPVTLALSYFLVYGELIPTTLLIILIFTVIAVPLNIRMLTQAIDTLPPSEKFSSRVLGDSSISAFFKIQLPRIKWEISTIVSLTFITVMGEFSSIVTVYTSSTETLTIGIYRLLLLRYTDGVYYLTEIFLIAIFISSFIINHLGKSGPLGQT
ncbi:MAG: ABC transporter permease [Thermoplasmata archaeon]